MAAVRINTCAKIRTNIPSYHGFDSILLAIELILEIATFFTDFPEFVVLFLMSSCF